jgi:2-phosphosulfolactate phosphatase
MPGHVRTFLLPQLATAQDFAGAVAVMIDQLRASTTICAALAAGATEIIPTLEPEEAERVKSSRPPGACLTGGERGGLLIPGFDLDNSPASYTPQRVAGKAIAFTTTNGTKAALIARDAAALHVGCLANVSALAAAIGADDRPVALLCAGTRDRVTLEDCLAAGAIAAALVAHGRPIHLPDARPDDDSTLLCLRLWESALASPGGVLGALRISRGARNLTREGLADDIARCAVMDVHPVVPTWDAKSASFRERPSEPRP